MGDAGGAVTGIFVLGSGVTERNQVEAAPRDSEERLRMACEAADLGIYDEGVRRYGRLKPSAAALVMRCLV